MPMRHALSDDAASQPFPSATPSLLTPHSDDARGAGPYTGRDSSNTRVRA